jgi:trigger factor
MDIPNVMIEKEIDIMLKDLEMRLKYQGLDLQAYYEYTNNTEEKVREYMRDAAEKRVKSELVINEIAKTENITVTDEELLNKATEMAKQYGDKDIEKTAKLIVDAQHEYLKSDVISEKVVNLLVENSKVTA